MTKDLSMYDLTPRQIEILKHIVREYTDSAEPVGSETLEKKYDLGVSPATIRNEMAAMAQKGYLSKPHTSAGRIPTSKALKLYIHELMREKDLSVAEEVEAKEKVWDARNKEDKFFRQITQNLAQKTHSLAVTTTGDGGIYFAGYSNILEMPEFYDFDVTRNLLSLLDNQPYFGRIIEKLQENGLGIFLGDELGDALYNPYSFVFAKFDTKNHETQGCIGVVGPARLRYEQVVPFVRYYGDLIEDVAEW